MNKAILNTPLGSLEITGNPFGVSAICFLNHLKPNTRDIPSFLQPVVIQLQEYFDGNRKIFDLILAPQGTLFQKKVWDHLSQIPFGRTLSYRDIAKALGDPKVIRAAANANGKNPIAIVIPCHRVIGSDGSLTGYAGGLHRKKWLLEHESPITQTSLF